MSPLPTLVTRPFVFGKPVNIWLGTVLAVLLALRVLLGTRVLKLPLRGIGSTAS
jgi:hypothetical protein